VSQLLLVNIKLLFLLNIKLYICSEQEDKENVH